ncbi:YhhA family cyclophane-containing RiPP [Duganella levis]|uniref:YhhA family cyclophane-containing RiPP n=1 Tax=Duganella levis TaxID=2692169 RepID=UPI0035311EF3
MQTSTSPEVQSNVRVGQANLAVDLSLIANPTLVRLLAEVKNDEGNTMGSYDRAHNRHNRS